MRCQRITFFFSLSQSISFLLLSSLNILFQTSPRLFPASLPSSQENFTPKRQFLSLFCDCLQAQALNPSPAAKSPETPSRRYAFHRHQQLQSTPAPGPNRANRRGVTSVGRRPLRKPTAGTCCSLSIYYNVRKVTWTGPVCFIRVNLSVIVELKYGFHIVS